MKPERSTSLRRITLQQKTFLFLLLPTFLILVAIGVTGLQLVSNVLLEQWQETAIAKLQRSAHHVDMRLMRPKELLRFLQHDNIRNNTSLEYQLVLEQLRMQDGVVEVNSTWYSEVQSDFDTPVVIKNLTQDDSYYQLQQLAISPPQYNSKFMSETVSIIAIFKDSNNKPSGHIEVVISFYDLIDQIVKAPWWKSNEAVLVDDTGNILTGTGAFTKDTIVASAVTFGLFEEYGQLEKNTWAAMQENVYGTVFDAGIPPERVSGFYRLSEAPWTMVIMSPGTAVLQPIITFRNYYFLTGGFGIILALLYIKLIIGRITNSIIRVSQAANNLAKGTFKKPLRVISRDEVGELTQSFNVMAHQLQERLVLREEMNLAREVQQNLLPHNNYSTEGLEISGISLYCQQTGGDYFDLLPSDNTKGKATVVVSDVVGHGIGAALIMTSVRAMLRSRSKQPGTPVQIISDVNELLCQDTCHSGNFATLFYFTVDRTNRKMSWVRCGHDPALVYSVDKHAFSELRGEGLVLGFDNTYQFQENHCDFEETKQVILISTDGVWDAENLAGERFGKDRVKDLLVRYHYLSAESILKKITDNIEGFLAGHPQNDDITMAIIKTW